MGVVSREGVDVEKNVVEGRGAFVSTRLEVAGLELLGVSGEPEVLGAGERESKFGVGHDGIVELGHGSLGVAQGGVKYKSARIRWVG
jgi:hypothetical protein